MIEYRRKYPLFSLCGLNCGLCPRYQTDSISKCPGCGGKDFHLKHPACAVITCNKKHDNVEYCFQCSSFPCDRYGTPSKADSFITYRNVVSDLKKANEIGLDKYQNELAEKVNILECLIKNYNDGRRKSFYCLAVNLIKLSDLNEIMEQINNKIELQDMEIKEKTKLVIELLESKAKKAKIELKLKE
jgi:hypothetical protein